jgi:hypothetical protein
MVSDKLEQALVRASVAEKVAEKALDMAMEALTKVKAMEQSTHKAYFVNPTTNVEELEPPHPYEGSNISQKDLEESLDKLFEASRGHLDVDDAFMDEN